MRLDGKCGLGYIFTNPNVSPVSTLASETGLSKDKL
jgi:hypothetical protein